MSQKRKGVLDARLHLAAELDRSGQYHEACLEARRVLTDYPNDEPLIYQVAAILIDSGDDGGDLDALREGIALTTALIASESDFARSNAVALLYNLSNGHFGESLLLKRAGDITGANTASDRQRGLLHELLSGHELDGSLKSSVAVNHALRLRDRGRVVECLDHLYDCLSFVPLNRNAALQIHYSIARIFERMPAHKRFLLYEMHQMVSLALADTPSLLQISGLSAVESAQRALADVVAIMERSHRDGVAGAQEWGRQHIAGHADEPESDFAARAIRDRLLLTAHPCPTGCVSECRDEAFFTSLSSPIETDDNEWFRPLCYIFNQIKEEFALARLMYYGRSMWAGDLADVGALERYGQSYGMASFGSREAMLKASLRLSYDILDKIAFFLNRYLKLGHADNRVDFNKIWFQGLDLNKKVIDERVATAMATSQWLTALLDMRNDVRDNNFPVGAHELRRAATHRSLVVDTGWDFDYGSIETVSAKTLEKLVFRVLRMTKAAAVYLGFFVDEHEAALQAADPKRTVRLTFDVVAPDEWEVF